VRLLLDENQISDITPLAGLTDLGGLFLTGNQISDITPLAGLTDLGGLFLTGNQISDITPLAGLTSLTHLNLESNQISDIAPLVSNAGIDSGDYVDVQRNYLTLIPSSADMQNIQALINRGIDVVYEPQNSPDNPPPDLEQDSIIGEYINPLNPDDCLGINADGTCYIEILGLNVGTTGRWKLENERISLLFPDGTTFRGMVKTDAILLEGFGMLPIVWIKPTKSPTKILDVTGKYVKEDHPNEYLVLNVDGTYTKTERGIGDQLLTTSGEWELDDHAVTLFYLGDRTAGISAAVLENRLYFTGLFGTDIWIGEPREEPTPEEVSPVEAFPEPEEETIPGGGEPPEVEWERFFSTSGEDRGMTVQQTDDGGYIVLGNTTSKLNGYDIPVIWLIKTDAFGIKEWERTFGGEAEACEGCGYSVEQTSDGGYIIIGTATSNQLDVVWLIKTDVFGIKEWERTFGGDAEGCEAYGYSVEQTSDGGYIVVGEINRWTETYSDIWLIKTDGSGNREWENAFGGPSRDWGLSIEQTNDDGYIIGGIAFRGSDWDVHDDMWLVKIDPLGKKEWDRFFGGKSTESIGNVQQTDDGGYIIVGTTKLPAPDFQFHLWLIKTDGLGNEEWSSTFETVPERAPACVQQTDDGGYIICTTSEEYRAGETVRGLWLLKTDCSGNAQWSEIFGENAMGAFVEQTRDGGYIALGRSFATDSEGDIWLIKLKGTGVAPSTERDSIKTAISKVWMKDCDIVVTVDAQQYTIATLKHKIDPDTLEPIPESGPTTVYLDLEGNPVSDVKIVQKIGLIETAREEASLANLDARIVDLEQLQSQMRNFTLKDMVLGGYNLAVTAGMDLATVLNEMTVIKRAGDALSTLGKIKDLAKTQPTGLLTKLLTVVMRKLIWDPMKDAKHDLESYLSRALERHKSAREVLNEQGEILDAASAVSFLNGLYFGEAYEEGALYLFEAIFKNYARVLLKAVSPIVGMATFGLHNFVGSSHSRQGKG